MANAKLTALTAASALDGTELVYGSQGGNSRKITTAQVKTLTSASPTLVTPNIGTPSAGVATNITGLPISTGLTGAGTGVLTALGVNVGSAGAPVLFNGAGGTPSSLVLTNASGTVTNLTLVTPVLGTPQSGTLTNCTLPAGGITGLGTGVATWLATPSSANLAAAITDETGTGALVFGTSPTISTKLTVTGATETTTNPAINATQTWNASGVTFTGILANITNTASAAASMLMDLQVGGVSQFSVRKDGFVTSVGGIIISSYLSSESNIYAQTNAGQFILGQTQDVRLARDAAGVLALRVDINPQALRVYNTYTDASNYERVGLTWASNVAKLAPASAGTGTARMLILNTGTCTVANLPTGAVGDTAFVTDANTTFVLGLGLTVAGGGSNKVPVYHDGTNWIVG